MSNDTTTPEPPKNLFGYEPSLTLNVVALVGFTAVTVAHFYLSCKFKNTAFFSRILIAGCLMELVGYAIRLDSRNNVSSIGPFIISLLLILIAPTVIGAADYALVSELMVRGHLKFRFFSPRVVRWAFLFADIGSFFIQGIGGSMVGSAASSGSSTLNTLGSDVIQVGLAISLSVFGIFGLVCAYFHWYINQKAREEEKAGGHIELEEDSAPPRASTTVSNSMTSWRTLFWVLYFDMLLLVIRSIYRVVEFASGRDSSVRDNEGLFYGLDALMMGLVLAVWIPFHPGNFDLGAQRTQETAEPSL